MKYIPIDDQSEVSRSRSEAIGPSLQVDSRGFPHLVWFGEKNNQYSVNYSFWDGQQWGHYKDNSVLYTSSNDIFLSQSSFILENAKPTIVFSERQNDGNSNLCLVRDIDNKLFLNRFTLGYSVKWVGIIRHVFDVTTGYESSSSSSEGTSSSESLLNTSSSSSSSSSEGTSSSESLLNTSSSSSSNDTGSSSSSSSSSRSSWSSPSSSSSIDSESSESIGNFSSSSSSSSSETDEDILICIYDSTNGKMKIYSISPLNVLRLVTEQSVPLVDPVIKIATDRFHISFMVLDEDMLSYNFFRVDDDDWAFNSFQSFNASGPVAMPDQDMIVDFDIDSYYSEDISYLHVGWLTKGTNFYISAGFIDNYGNESPTDLSSYTVEALSSNISAGSYTINGYSCITLSTNGAYPQIFVSGSTSKQFSLNAGFNWVPELVDLGGVSGGNKPRRCYSSLSDGKFRIVFDSNGGIYYFEESSQPNFEISGSDLLLLTEAEMLHGTYRDSVLNPTVISSIGNNRFGDIIREYKRPIFVTTGDLSSSSSSSSESSQGFIPESESSSGGYSVSESSSGGYSESSSGGPFTDCTYCLPSTVRETVLVTFSGTTDCDTGCVTCYAGTPPVPVQDRYNYRPEINNGGEPYYLHANADAGTCVWDTLVPYSGYYDNDNTISCDFSGDKVCPYELLRIRLEKTSPTSFTLQAIAISSCCASSTIFDTSITVTAYECASGSGDNTVSSNACSDICVAPQRTESGVGGNGSFSFADPKAFFGVLGGMPSMFALGPTQAYADVSFYETGCSMKPSFNRIIPYGISFSIPSINGTYRLSYTGIGKWSLELPYVSHVYAYNKDDKSVIQEQSLSSEFLTIEVAWESNGMLSLRCYTKGNTPSDLFYAETYYDVGTNEYNLFNEIECKTGFPVYSASLGGFAELEFVDFK